MSPSLAGKLLKDRNCLHIDEYFIFRKRSAPTCGPCFFREVVKDELPTRISIREGSGNHGAPAIDPNFINHVLITSGFSPPNPGESMRAYRKRRSEYSWIASGRFPVTAAIWQLMGYQPPLATVLIEFVGGSNELQIAEAMDLSIYNVKERLRKSVHTAERYLRN